MSPRSRLQMTQAASRESASIVSAHSPARGRPSAIHIQIQSATQTGTHGRHGKTLLQKPLQATKALQQPDLTFAEWMKERDVCRDHKGDASFRSGHFLFNIAFFCNTNRLWDVVTQQLQTAIARQPKRVQVATVFLLRMAGSPRDEEKPGQSGAAAIAGQMTADAFPARYVRAMPFTGRKTYRAVLNREELAIIGEDVVAALASLEVCDSLPALCDHVDRAIKQASEKHTVALADMRAREEKPQDNTERCGS